MKINKLYIIEAFLIIILFFAHIETGYAAQDEENMGASVSINPVFGIKVSPGSIDFPTIDPGETTEERELIVECSTNTDTPWSLQLSNIAELTSESEAYTIPNDNFYWEGSGGEGIWYPGTGTMSTTPHKFYGCDGSEYITVAPVEAHLKFKVSIPENQAAGKYNTMLVITMTEEGL